MTFSIEQLAAATGSSIADAAAAHPHLQTAMAQFSIDGRLRQAAFFATIAIESAHLAKTEEDLYYKDAARLASIYPRAFVDAQAAEPYTRNPRGLSDLLYQGYHGRGYIQLTWRANYERATDVLSYNYAGNPALVCAPQHAALTAAWAWEERLCNVFADAADMTTITRRVNGPALMHLDARERQYRIALKVLA